jgi:hypothetical protein
LGIFALKSQVDKIVYLIDYFVYWVVLVAKFLSKQGLDLMNDFYFSGLIDYLALFRLIPHGEFNVKFLLCLRRSFL